MDNVTGTKTSTFYNGNNVAIFSVKVTGTFQYTGTGASCIGSTATVSLYTTSASFISKSASRSGATATATGSVKYNGVTISRTVNLTCDKNGNLS